MRVAQNFHMAAMRAAHGPSIADEHGTHADRT